MAIFVPHYARGNVRHSTNNDQRFKAQPSHLKTPNFASYEDLGITKT